MQVNLSLCIRDFSDAVIKHDQDTWQEFIPRGIRVHHRHREAWQQTTGLVAGARNWMLLYSTTSTKKTEQTGSAVTFLILKLVHSDILSPSILHHLCQIMKAHACCFSLWEWERFLVYLFSHVLLVSSNPSHSYSLLSPLLWSSHISEERRPKNISNLDFLSLHNAGDLHPLWNASAGKLSYDDWTKHWIMRIAEYH